MLKLTTLSRSTMCIMVSSQLLSQNIRRKSGTTGFEEIKLMLTNSQHDSKNTVSEIKKSRQKWQYVSAAKRNAVKSILEKYNIDTTYLANERKIYLLSPWIIEQRIMLLQELGIRKLTLTTINKFIFKMYLPVTIYKANFDIDSNCNIAENIFFHLKNSKIDYRDIDDLDENTVMRKYYAKCFLHYLKQELDLNEDEVRYFGYKKRSRVMYNSFRLIEKLLKFLRNDLHFNNSLIKKNRWLLTQHPTYLENIFNVIENEFKDTYLEILLKYPKILTCELENLQTVISYIKQYEIKTEKLQMVGKIFLIKSEEFKTRVDNLLQIPLTLVYYKHAKFLLLVRDYYNVLPRVRYLEENNLKYASIPSLTRNQNYAEQLHTSRRTTITDLRSFCESIFKSDDYDDLLRRIIIHPSYIFVSLLQMYETTMYLREHFSEEVIYKHIYAILYNKKDLETARQILLTDQTYKKWSSGQFLALCVYTIEVESNFTGNAVLNPEKYAEKVQTHGS